MSGAGYQSEAYAASLREFGEPVRLPASDSWCLRRKLPGADGGDAMHCYPLMVCGDWSALPSDLAALERELVSFSFVTDPFAQLDVDALRPAFDVFFAFKDHYVADLTSAPDRFVTKHHRYYARRALEAVQVELAPDPVKHVDVWTRLYGTLVARHGLVGLKAFSRSSFEAQLAVPGTRLFLAHAEGVAVGAHVFFVQGDRAYSHLTAFTERGYELMASYALHWKAIEALAHEVKWLHLGAGPGAGEAVEQGGLAWFKSGWSTGTRTVYFGGKVLDRSRYDALASALAPEGTTYFPAYRAGELA